MTLRLTKMPERHVHADDGAGWRGNGGESSFSGQIFHHRKEMFRAKQKMGKPIIDISLFVMYDDTCHSDVKGWPGTLVTDYHFGQLTDEAHVDITSPSSDHMATFSPPPPPPHFNPPAGFPADSPSESISPPGSATITSPTKFLPVDTAPFRPSSASVRRISTESVPTPGSGSSSVSSSQSGHSEGGGHLVEMRERLRSESSTSSTPPGRSRASSHATQESSRLSITSSNASTETVVDDSAEEQHYERLDQTRRLSSGVLARLEEPPDFPMEHAWDSVVRRFLFSS